MLWVEIDETSVQMAECAIATFLMIMLVLKWRAENTVSNSSHCKNISNWFQLVDTAWRIFWPTGIILNHRRSIPTEWKIWPVGWIWYVELYGSASGPWINPTPHMACAGPIYCMRHVKSVWFALHVAHGAGSSAAGAARSTGDQSGMPATHSICASLDQALYARANS